MYSILLIEDNQQIIKSIEKHIDFHSLNALYLGAASDGRVGFDMIVSLKPDLVICDISLPSMSGLDIIKKAYELQLKSQFIIMSGHDNFAYAQEAIHYGVLEYLLKPAFPPEIEKAIKKAINGIYLNPTYSQQPSSEKQFLSDKFFMQQAKAVKKSNTLVWNAINFIHANYMKQVTLIDISKQLHISANHLRNLFIKETGMTFNNYLTQYRICIARQLLSSGKYMVYEVAALVGYADVPSFRKIFKKFTDTSPSDLLPQNRSDQPSSENEGEDKIIKE